MAKLGVTAGASQGQPGQMGEQPQGQTGSAEEPEGQIGEGRQHQLGHPERQKGHGQ